jgi:hypothetical protein
MLTFEFVILRPSLRFGSLQGIFTDFTTLTAGVPWYLLRLLYTRESQHGPINRCGSTLGTNES